MKRTLMVAVVAALALVWAGAVYADTTTCDVAEVWVELKKNIAINAKEITGPMPEWQVASGDFVYDVIFAVAANTQEVKFEGAASKMFKGCDPLGTEVAPIDVKKDAGMDFAAPNADPVGGGDGHVEYVVDPYMIGLFPGYQTASLTMTSSQNGTFAQDLTLTVTWEAPTGDQMWGPYCAKVELCGSVVF